MRQIGGGDGETRMLLLIVEPRLYIWVLIRAFGIDFAIEIVSDQFTGKVRCLSTIPEHHTVTLQTY